MPSPSLFLEWFDTPPDSVHSSAKTSISAVWEQNEGIGTAVSRFPWIVDGIDNSEEMVLKDLAFLVSGHPKLAARVLAFPWINAAEQITDGAARAVSSLTVTARIDEELAVTMSGYAWLRDSIGSSEGRALEAIAVVAAADLETARKFASRDGFIEGRSLSGVTEAANTISSLYEIDPDAAQVAVIYPSLEDGISESELRTLAGVLALARATKEFNRGVATTVAGYPWVADGLTFSEYQVISDFTLQVSASERLESGFALRLVDQKWVQDGVTGSEIEVLGIFRDLLEVAQKNNARAVELLIGYSWLGDGLSQEEVTALDAFRGILEIVQGTDGRAVEALAGHAWVADGLTKRELDTLYIFFTLFESVGASGSSFPEHVVSYYWVADGIEDTEPDTSNRFRDLYMAGEAANTAAAEAIAAYAWVKDGISKPESDALYQLLIMLEAANSNSVPFFERVVSYPWVGDGLTPHEMRALRNIEVLLQSVAVPETEEDAHSGSRWKTECAVRELRETPFDILGLLASDSTGRSALAGQLLGAPWLADSLTPQEVDTLGVLAQSLRPLDPLDEQISQRLAGYPWGRDGISSFECWALVRLRYLLDDSGDDLVGLPWFDDGIDDEELAFLSVLDATKGFSPQRYNDLLDSHYSQTGFTTLPLAGEVRLFVFQDKPFREGNDYVLDMKNFASFMEEFMGVPFPRKFVVARTIESKNYDDEDEKNVGGGYSLRDQIVITSVEENFDAPEILLHEMAHLYWGGHIGAPTWLIEGAAEFLAFFALDDFGGQPLPERKVELTRLVREVCAERGAGTIEDLLRLEASDPEKYLERAICTYHLGEIPPARNVRSAWQGCTSDNNERTVSAGRGQELERASH